MSGLTTHILDTSLGLPAEGVHIKLFKYSQDGFTLINEVVTNIDGRSEQPLLTSAQMEIGTYQLLFEMAPYFKHTQNNLIEPLFLSDIPIQFSISDKDAHYHVPLLVSPFGFSTYRGS
ncbi:hydroxyisourate hydrolase [Thiomicrorhabdus hydrogeniphila]